ncbi:MAG: hypothetical protein PHX14_13320 [Syntrophomonadaceae bacterium]|nr:hypothetical protein [Syntrophomonadaceae bacterium]
MNVSFNPSILSTYFSNLRSNSLTNSTESTTSTSSWFNGTDTVEISQAAINALLASEEDSSSANGNAATYDLSEVLQSKLDELVEDGTITEEQEVAIQSAVEETLENSAAVFSQTMGTPPPPKAGGFDNMLSSVLDDLASTGTITEEQESAILTAIEESFQSTLKPPRPEEGGFEGMLSSKLDELVSAGTITEEQETVILSALEEISQATAPPSPPRSEEGGIEDVINAKLDELVSAGTITEDQKDAVSSALKPSGPPPGGPPPGGPPPAAVSEESEESSYDTWEKILEETLEELTATGTITTEQQSSIFEALKASLA